MAEPAKHRDLAWPLAGLLAVLALQVTLVLHRAVNWDEFFHYSQIHNLDRGTLTGPLQTLYTRAFHWVLDLPGSGIDHIVTIRWFMLGCELAILTAIYAMARRFVAPATALLCTLAYLSAGYVFQHGTSFRFDPPATAMLMGAAWITLQRPLRPGWIMLAGLLIGTAAVLTIKSVLYAPVFAGIAWLRWSEGGRSAASAFRLAGIGIASAAGFALVYWLHASTLPGQTIDAARATVGQNGGKMFGLFDQPYWLHHLKGAALAPFVTIMVLLFPFVLRRAAIARAEKIALVGMMLPLTTLLFYHNTAPYYFVFMLAPVCVGLALVIERAVERYGVRGISLGLVALTAAVWWIEKPELIERQRAIVAAAETAFPDKPAYFDACAILGSFPKANVFMTPVGLALYRDGQYPAFADLMAREPIPLVVNDGAELDAALTGTGPVPQLLPRDLAALRANYVPFWGPFWVAGYRVKADRPLDVGVPGRYRVEGGTFELNGRTVQPDTIVDLERGPQTVAVQPGVTVRLIWADAVRPITAPPPAPFFEAF